MQISEEQQQLIKEPESKPKNAKEKQIRKKQVGFVVTPDLYERIKYTAWKERKTINSWLYDLADANAASLEEAKEQG